MKKFYLIFILTFISVQTYSQTWWHGIRTPGHYYQRGWDICQLTDSNFIIAGQEETGTFSKINLLKINKYGSVLWSKFYSEVGVPGILAYACTSTKDNGCVISGIRNDRIPYAMKVDLNGNKLWNKSYEGHNIYDRTVQIQKCSDNGYILCGLDYLLKIDSSGQYVWSKSDIELGIMGDIYSVVESIDNCYICLCYQINSNVPVVIKVNKDGNLQWQKAFIDMNSYCSIIRKLSNCYLLMGFVPDSIPYPNTNFKYFFAKIDTAGNVISQHQGFDSTGRTEHFLRGLDVLNDNRFIFTSDDYFDNSNDSLALTVFKIVDSIGNIIHKNIIRRTSKGGYDPYNILNLKDGFIMYVGTAYFSRYSSDLGVFMARTDTTLYIDPLYVHTLGNNIPEGFSLFQNYPNPFNPSTNIKYTIPKLSSPHVLSGDLVLLKVFDILGKEVATLVNEKQKPGTYEVTFNAEGLSSGIYFYSLFADGKILDSKKMILLK